MLTNKIFNASALQEWGLVILKQMPNERMTYVTQSFSICRAIA